MKKIFIALLLIVSSITYSQAQTVSETSVKFGKSQANGVVAEYNIPKDLIESTLRDDLAKQGLGKRRSQNHYDFYEGVIWSSISTDKLDVYVDVSGKKDKSTVTIVLSKGYDNFVSSTTDATTIENVKNYLKNLVANANTYQLDLDIKAQEKAVEDAKRDYEKSVKNGSDLQSDKEKIEKRIADNKKDQADKSKQLEEAKNKLDILKSKKHN